MVLPLCGPVARIKFIGMALFFLLFSFFSSAFTRNLFDFCKKKTSLVPLHDTLIHAEILEHHDAQLQVILHTGAEKHVLSWVSAQGLWLPCVLFVCLDVSPSTNQHLIQKSLSFGVATGESHAEWSSTSQTSESTLVLLLVLLSQRFWRLWMA